MTTDQIIEKLTSEGGALVCSDACSAMEIAHARAESRFATSEDGIGYVLRTKEWLALQKAREDAHPNTAGRYSSTATDTPSNERALGAGFYLDAKPGTFGRAEWLDLLMACQDGRATCMRVLEIIERETELQLPDVHKMTEAFLRHPLPESVCADLCATKQGPGRVGTNLLSYVEARQIFETLLATGSPVYWQSWAEWPEGLVNNQSGEGRNTTVDRHDTEEQAKGVCLLLERKGFGGELVHFPVRTWVIPVYRKNTKA